ncbi:MAG: type I polyketide synthase, partial [Cyanobacteria bacterium J06627_8]
MREFSNLVDLLRFRAASTPNSQAFVFLRDGEEEDNELTYRDLDQRARAIAAALQDRGASGERALLLYSPNLDFITAFWGCLYAGVLAVPAYPPRPNQTLTRLRAILEDSAAAFAMTTGPQLANMGRLLEQNPDFATLQWVTTDDVSQGIEDTWSPRAIATDTLAFLQYTSGSTGTPKGVMVSHSNLMHNARFIRESFDDSSESKSVCWLPPYHDMGLIGGVLQPIYLGAPAALMSPVSFLQRPFRWLKAMSYYRARTAGAPNFAYDLCVRQVSPEQREQLDLSNWTLAFSGAEPVRAETIERFSETFAPCGFRKEAFYPCYGMAEATLFVTGGDRQSSPTVATVRSQSLERSQIEMVAPDETVDDEEIRQLVSCGRCHPEQTLRIVNPETQEICPENTVGEIWVSGAGMAQGYWKRPQQSIETFYATIAASANDADTSSDKQHPFLRTGDLGFLNNDELFVTGRIKDLIVIRGLNHYPQDIELTVDQCNPALRQGCSAAFSVDVEGEERLILAQEVERRALRQLPVADITQAVRQAIAEHHQLQIHAVVLLKTGSIPKTSSGKIQRHACKAGFLEGTLDVVGQWNEADAAHSISSTPDLPDLNGQASQALTVPTSEQALSIQQWLVTQLADKLNVAASQISVHEPFARYGLDSITAIRLSAELEDWLGRSLAPTIVYDYPTIASLAAYLGQSEEDALSTQSHSFVTSELRKPRQENEAIAIVGMGCRFPGAENLDAFWQLLKSGQDAIHHVTDRWHGQASTTTGGFLDHVDQFDPQFFGISPREAVRMDPQQRLLLEVCWETLEQAGIAPESLAGSNTGVFVGISNTDYAQLQVRSSSRSDTAQDAYSGTGNAHSITANRLSYTFDLHGPSLSIDTACSSSLVAVHVACQHIRQGDCDQAIVGGVNLILAPDLTTTFTQAGMMASDHRCKTFDVDADGYVRGEGCGVILLKPLSHAQANGDTVLAVIRGSAVNQDGRSNGLTAPNGPAQQAVVRQAIQQAGLTPDQLSYVDAHGTGTPLGDPIELNSLKTVLMEGRSPEQACWVGSVKPNIGHLESAAGIAGLIKTALALYHQEIPPHLNFQTLNPHIDLDQTPIQIPTEHRRWESSAPGRFAGVSSFGFGGTNAHVVLADAPIAEKQNESSTEVRQNEPNVPVGTAQELTNVERPRHIVTLSAKSEAALHTLVKRHIAYLDDHPDVAIADVGFTVNVGRSHLTHRLALAAETSADLKDQLTAFSQQVDGQSGASQVQTLPIQTGKLQNQAQPKIVFLFTGQGSQYVNMGRELYETQPVFREAIHQCDRLLRSQLEVSLIEVLFPSVDSPETLETAAAQLNQTEYTQPALFAVEYALAQLWLSWGIRPDAVMGHSVGEYVAACLAGVFSLQDGLKLMATRSRLMQALPAGGAMVAVFASESHVRTVIERDAGCVDLAAMNGIRNSVISGEQTAVDRIAQQLEADGIEVRPLQVSHAFHSALMEPMLDEFRTVAESVHYSVPQLPLVSNLSGQFADSAIAAGDYWCQHIRQPVQFAKGIETLIQSDYTMFLEVGPKSTLCSMSRQHLAEAVSSGMDKPFPNPVSLEWLPSLRSRRSNWGQVLQSLGKLYVSGVSVDWKDFDYPYTRHRVLDLPTYPWQRQRYWFTEGWEPDDQDSGRNESGRLSPQWASWLYEQQWIAHPYDTSQSHVNRVHSPGVWVVLSDRDGVGDAIATQLRRSGHQAIQVYPGEALVQESPTCWQINPAQPTDIEHCLHQLTAEAHASIDGVIHAWGLAHSISDDDGIDVLQQSQRLACQSALAIAQALVQHSSSTRPKLWMVTRHAVDVQSSLIPEQSQSVNRDQQTAPLDWDINPVHATLWGFAKVLAWEHPEHWGGIIDLDSDDAAHLNEAIVPSVVTTDGEQWLAIRQGHRYAMRLSAKRDLVSHGAEPREEEASASEGGIHQSSEQTTILITGGLGAIGLAVAERMAQHGVPHITLLGRRSPSTDVQTRLDAIRHHGTEVQVVQADVTQAHELSQVLETMQSSGYRLRGVIHAAGILQDGMLVQQTWEHFQHVLAPKMLGAWTLHQLTREMPLDFFVMFSSVASLIGSPGQGNYAAANAFLDGLAAYRKAHQLPALSLNWGLWDTAGMANQLDDRSRSRIAVRGIDAIAPNVGLDILSHFIFSDGDDFDGRLQTPAQLGVFPIRWHDFLKKIPENLRPSYLVDIEQTVFMSPVSNLSQLHSVDDKSAMEQDSTDVFNAPHPIFEQLRTGDRHQLNTHILDYLTQQCALVLQLDSQQIQASDNLLELGMDSLMVMEAMTQIRQDLQLMLYPREFYERPRLEQLAEYLAAEFERIHLAPSQSSDYEQPASANHKQPLTLLDADT